MLVGHRNALTPAAKPTQVQPTDRFKKNLTCVNTNLKKRRKGRGRERERVKV